MKQAVLVFGVGLLLAGLVFAGCGGSNEGSSTGTGTGAGQEVKSTSEPKAKYVAKANALCQKRRREIQADLNRIVKSLPENGSDQAGITKVVEDAFLPGLEAELGELGKLGAPEGNEDQIVEILATIETAIAGMREDPVKFMRNPTAFAKAQRLAEAYGIGACGRVI